MGSTTFGKMILNFDHFPKSLFSKNRPYFWQLCHKLCYRISKKSSQNVHVGVKMYWIPPDSPWFFTIVTALLQLLLLISTTKQQVEWGFQKSTASTVVHNLHTKDSLSSNRFFPLLLILNKIKVCFFLQIW